VDLALQQSGYTHSLGLLLDEQATHDSVVTALAQLGTLPSDALVVVYYIGHGIPVAGGDDLRLSVANEPVSATYGVPVREVLRDALGVTDPLFRKIPRIIFILETCYSSAGSSFLLERFHAQLQSAKRLVFLSATSTSEQARPIKKNGPFAFGTYLVSALSADWDCADSTPDGALTALELRTYLAAQLSTAKSAGDIDGPMTPDLIDFGLYSTIAYRPDRVADLNGFRNAIREFYVEPAPGVVATVVSAENETIKECQGPCGVLTDSWETLSARFSRLGFDVKAISGSDLIERLSKEVYETGRGGTKSVNVIGRVTIR
jgi:hypothetical protein